MEVILDIDGVLANFNKRAVEALGYNYEENKHLLNKWTWYENFGLTFQELNGVCGEGFWEGIQWTDDGRAILKMLEDWFGGENITLCTTPMPNPCFGAGRMRWIDRHLPEYSKKWFIGTASKAMFAKPGRLLVDDKDENVETFVDAEGRGILVPRLHNKLRKYADSSLSFVAEVLQAKFRKEQYAHRCDW